MLRIKSGVGAARLSGLRPEMAAVLAIAPAVFGAHGHDAVVTSGCEGKHKISSGHYTGRALDIRLNNIPSVEHTTLRDECKAALGDDFDVILENSGTTLVHLHIEFDPKTAVGL